jgi:Sulfotransferase family
VFVGPLFLVGRPRSGTKLLRALLNGHPDIAIPFWESNFIPNLSSKAESFGDLDNRQNFHHFFQFFSQIEFFRMIRKEHKYAHIVDEEFWYDAVDNFGYAGVIETFYQLYAQCDGKKIWGDKSPHYMLSVKYLSEQFPNSKFIHIIRDVRDNCLSNMIAWKKNPYRCAQLWVDSITYCRSEAAMYLKNRYLEVKYELLLDDPERELTNICEFLDIQYVPEMSSLGEPVENTRAAKGQREIVKSNKGKWQRAMPKSMIKEIEAISYEMLKELGYSSFYATRRRKLNRFHLGILRFCDAWNRFRFDCSSQGGWANAIVYQYRKRTRG